MIDAWCDKCGARFRVEDSFAGKSARCGRCKSRIQIPSTSQAAQAQAIKANEKAQAKAQEDMPYEAQTTIAGAASSASAIPLNHAAKPQNVRAAGQKNTYTSAQSQQSWAAQLTKALGFAVSKENLVGYLVLSFFAWILFFTAGNFCIGWIGAVLTYGTAITVMLTIILETTDGRDALMSMMKPTELSELFISIRTMIISVVWALIPCAPACFALAYFDVPNLGLWLENTIYATMLIFWPMTTLILATQGYEFSLLRYDVIIRNIFRTFSAYAMLAMLILVLQSIVMACDNFIPGAAGLWRSEGAIWAKVGGSLVSMFIKVYCYVTMMRLIGVYYLSQKGKFTW